jgi:hypothetical protein
VEVEDPDDDASEDDDDDERGSDDDSSSTNHAPVHPGILRRTRSSSISLLSVSSSVGGSANRSLTYPTAFTVHGTPPPGRNGHTATLVKRKGGLRSNTLHEYPYDYGSEQTCIFMIGGWLGVGPFAASDMYILDITDVPELRWVSVSPQDISGVSPGPCNMHSADFVSSQNEIYIFRGGNGREYLNDTHALHVDTLTWRRVETTGAVPQPRANHSSAILDETNELVIFGGWCDYYL